MLLQYFYDDKLAQASYLVGCQAANEAVVIDPARDVQPYIKAAEEHGMTITGVMETHIHADYLCGARELADRTGAVLYVSDEGPAEWKYENIDKLNHQLLKDQDQIKLGKIRFDVMHTPGHTPESVSFLVTDGGAEADEPLGIFTGDFVFVGDIGRPDLLEKAAKQKDTAAAGAEDMFHSLEKFKQLPDFTQVLPGHGAGSACGKSLGSVPSSTVGYEKRFNWALQYTDKEQFKQDLVEDQPEPPVYFAEMKRVNKEGPAFLKDLADPEVMGKELLQEAVSTGQVIDTRPPEQFAAAHMEGVMNLPLNKSFTNWAGWLLNYEDPIYAIVEENQVDELKTALRSIGLDQLKGWANPSIAMTIGKPQSFDQLTPEQASDWIESGSVHVLDVRGAAERKNGYVEGSTHIMLGELPHRIKEVPTDKPVLVQCGTGLRSAIGASILQKNGITDVKNMMGGFGRFAKMGSEDVIVDG
ncbi:MBL fold metallo-hydrolase [Alkalicoccus luteus]|uniref:MBL fold metallo-hydrolase n=1 Tax=Alkalicoccus luteus TaxID=1237094 RepID=A0A969PMG0_9BACI|nr:MBL fold metallo-hydrolase [Alkalicoccus luteus]NJP36120.1 MBL fold metallo-hydrolase [Alkalicoccus luteus]